LSHPPNIDPTKTPKEAAQKFYLIAKAMMGVANVSPIFPLNLIMMHKEELSRFSHELSRLAIGDGLQAEIINHRDLSSSEKEEFVSVLGFDNNEFVRKEVETKKRINNRIYFQLQKPI
jgi:hypothetical protein